MPAGAWLRAICSLRLLRRLQYLQRLLSALSQKERFDMALLLGVFIAISIGLAGRWSGMDRDRAVYPVILIVIASYYVLFSLIAGFGQGVLMELSIAVFFAVCAFLGFRFSLWLVVLALALHGFFDMAHARVTDGNGAPLWWAEFCLGVDVVLALFLGWLIGSGRVSARGRREDL